MVASWKIPALQASSLSGFWDRSKTNGKSRPFSRPFEASRSTADNEKERGNGPISHRRSRIILNPPASWSADFLIPRKNTFVRFVTGALTAQASLHPACVREAFYAALAANHRFLLFSGVGWIVRLELHPNNHPPLEP